MESDIPNLNLIENILLEYSIFKEITPYRGEIDYERKQITLNPIFDMIETLAHELMHHYYDVFLGTGATEWFVIVKSQEIIKQQEVVEVIENHLKRAKISPTRNLFGMVG